MNFSRAEIAALRRIKEALPGIDIVLIGAAALREFGHCRWRSTFDLDLTVTLDEDTFPGPLEHAPALRRDERMQHRWHTEGVSLDVIPAGPQLQAQGYIRWGERTMSLAGMPLAFRHALARTLAPDLKFRVAPPPVIVVLKVISYCERPHERERDLEDFARLLDEYVQTDDDRRFSDRVIAANLSWEEVSAYELGFDVAQVITAVERPTLDRFLDRIRQSDAMGTLARLLRVSSFAREESERRLLQQLDAFVRGLTT